MMLHHVSVGVKDVVAAGRFYDAVLGPLGYRRVMDYSPGAIAYGEKDGPPEFWIGLPHDRSVATPGNGTHIAFAAHDIAAVQGFYKEALEQGAADEGEPGPRPEYGPDYYGAFARDADGNKIEAVLRPEPHVSRAKLPKPAKAKAKRTKAKAKKASTKKAGKAPSKKAKPVKKAAAKKAKTATKKAAKKPAKTKAKKKARKR